MTSSALATAVNYPAHYISGQWVKAGSSESLPVYDSSTDGLAEVLAPFTASGLVTLHRNYKGSQMEALGGCLEGLPRAWAEGGDISRPTQAICQPVTVSVHRQDGLMGVRFTWFPRGSAGFRYPALLRWCAYARRHSIAWCH